MSILINNCNIFVNWSEFVPLIHKPTIHLDSKCFSSWLACDIPFPQIKNQSFMESQSASHVFGKQRKIPCVDKLCHITTPNAVCLSTQKLWMETREPQRWNLRLAHVLLHVRDSSLWKGLLSGENKSLSLFESLFNIQDRGSDGSTGRSGSHLFFI